MLLKAIAKLNKPVIVSTGGANQYQIDNMVKKAHTMRFHSNENEKEAISIIESEFEKWNKH